jgi:hypothetical protein
MFIRRSSLFMIAIIHGDACAVVARLSALALAVGYKILPLFAYQGGMPMSFNRPPKRCDIISDTEMRAETIMAGRHDTIARERAEAWVSKTALAHSRQAYRIGSELFTFMFETKAA